MRENELEVLEQYEIDVNSTKKVRGAVLCDTSQGLYLLKEMNFSEKRLPELYEIYCYVQDKGFENVDILIQNKEGNLFSSDISGTKYVLKKWFYGRECDNKKEADILSMVQNLALLHHALRKSDNRNEDEIVAIRLKEDLHSEVQRHNRELKKIRSFIRKRVDKGEFETIFLKNFEKMYAWAEIAEKNLESDVYYKLLQSAVTNGTIIHGDYNYHNILMIPGGIATTNFEHSRPGIQLDDFYYFLRKTMEKNQWDVDLGQKILERYNRILPLSEADLFYLAIQIAYPEKFWKAADSYYRSRKVWISGKSIEKLNMAIRQTEEKKQFLQKVFSFQL